MSPILTAALDAYDAGLSVIPVRNDGSKRPSQAWKQFQVERADRDTVADWFTNTNLGLGVICGAVSGDLEMLELEGRFIDEVGTQRFKDAAKDAGIALLLSRLVNGFMVVSPSNGRHFYYRVAGEAEPNTKLARRPSTIDELQAAPDDRVKVLIETRGEGGFVVAPPSAGTVHQSGKSWTTKAGTFAAIPTITAEERAALFELCRTFDSYEQATSTPVDPVPPGQRVRLQRAVAVTDGGSWFDAVVEHLKHTTPIVGLLEHYGWKASYTDRHGRQLLTRPGKDDGVSGSINTNGRLCVFSTSTPFDSGRIPPTTYDALDVIAAYEHHGDRNTAARSIAERTGIIGMPTPPAPPPNVDPDTGEIVEAATGPFPDEFWNARPYLQHIRQAALSRLVAPAAVLGAVLARVAAFTPPSTCLPPTIGTVAPLSTYVALLARSGGGKSSSVGCAAELLPIIPAGCIGPLALGSGEGLVESYFEMTDDVDGNGKKTRVKRQTRHGALFTLDEGQALAEMGNRKGATIMPVVRTAWTGGDPGQANASIETRRTLRQGSYAVGIVSLWQYKAAARLLEDADGGTPQRFVFLDTTDRTISIDAPEWPGPLGWTPPPAIVMNGIMGHRHLELHPDIAHEIKSHHVAAHRGDVAVDPLDVHRGLAKAKVAGVLAVLDGRHHIDLDDWALAETIMAHSDSVRSWIVDEARRAREAADLAGARKQAKVAAVIDESVEARALGRAARAVWRAASRAGDGPLTRRMAHAAITSRDRQHVTTDDAVAESVRLGWLVEVGAGEWRVGESRPS